MGKNDFTYAPQNVVQKGHFKQSSGPVHQGPAYDQGHYGYEDKDQCSGKHIGLSQTEPGCVGEWYVDVEENDSEQH